MGGTSGSEDVVAGLSEAVIEADRRKKGVPPIDAGTAAVDYAAQQCAVPAPVVHVDFGGEARGSAAKAETEEDPEVAKAVEALKNGRLGYRFAKRAFDIVFSALVLVCLSWLFLIIAVLVKLDDPKGPVLFKQRRVGMTKDGKLTYFDMYKFRSMCVDAEAKLAALKSLNEKTGPVFKIAEDPRITRVGKWLRKLSLDELPQFFNVLMGDIPLRILKTRPEFSEKSMGMFALPAKSSTNGRKVFSQVASYFERGLRTCRVSECNSSFIGGMEVQFLAKPVLEKFFLRHASGCVGFSCTKSNSCLAVFS